MKASGYNIIVEDTKSNETIIYNSLYGSMATFDNVEFSSAKMILENPNANNIEYLGVLEYEDYQEILSSCEFGLSLRNPSEMEHRMNFPSKILEYMSFGCIAISSISYSELNKDTYLLTEYSIEGMQFFFKNILIDFNDLKRALIIKKALIEIENNYSANVFKSKIYNLID